MSSGGPTLRTLSDVRAFLLEDIQSFLARADEVIE
jgi:hypothetical protein